MGMNTIEIFVQLWKLENAAAGFNPSETALVTEELSQKAVLEDFLNVSHKQHFASPFKQNVAQQDLLQLQTNAHSFKWWDLHF